MAKRGKIIRPDNRKYAVFYSVIMIGLILLLIFFAIHSYYDYHSFRSHRDYFKNNTSPKIESWMTAHAILRHFNITSEYIFNTLNATNSSSNFIKPISTICAEQKENCTLILEKLNHNV